MRSLVNRVHIALALAVMLAIALGATVSASIAPPPASLPTTSPIYGVTSAYARATSTDARANCYVDTDSVTPWKLTYYNVAETGTEPPASYIVTVSGSVEGQPLTGTYGEAYTTMGSGFTHADAQCWLQYWTGTSWSTTYASDHASQWFLQ